MEKSESVTAEQCNPRTLRRELVDAIIDAYQDDAEDDSELFREATGEIVAIHERAIAKSTILRLAEEAEKEARSPKGDAIRKATYYAMAAWLREKAR